MSTHRTFCVVCGTAVYCSSDAHALGSGGNGKLVGCGGCDNPPYIEFCSLEHAIDLQKRLAAAIENYREVHGPCERPDCCECRAIGREAPRAYPKRSIMSDDDIMELGFQFFFETPR